MLARTDTWLRGRSLTLLLELPRLVRLCWRLLRDRRVPFWPKLILAGAVVYAVLPFDVIPDTLPLLGQVDDIVFLVTAARLFVACCPPALVHEHTAALAERR